MSLSSDEILRVIQDEARQTIGTSDQDSTLGEKRAKAIDYYNGNMTDFPHEAGWSKVTTSDVYEVIEAAMPDLLEVFAASEDVMEFEPESEDDVDQAQQETDAVNYVFYQQNSGFMILHGFIKDALLEKNGFVKTTWEERETEEIEEYFNQTEEDLALLKSDDDIEITEVITTKEKTGEFAPKIEIVDGQPVAGEMIEMITVTHHVTARRTKDTSGVRIQGLPVEEVAISRNSRSIQEASLVSHQPRNVTRSNLLELKISKDLVEKLTTITEGKAPETIARDTLNQLGQNDDTINRPEDKVDVKDNYIRMDVNGEGRTELWHVMTGNNDTIILSKTRISRVPISTMTPIIMTHQVFGKSLAELTMDLQRISTYLTRAAMDNVAMTNNQRPIISESAITDTTIDDVLMNRVGSPIMVTGDVNAALTYAPNNPIAGDMLSLVQYFDAKRADRTGIQRSGQSMDTDSIRKDISATEFSGQRSDALKTIRMIARVFAETGIKDMMINIHHELRSHSGDKAISMRLNGKFVQVHPREWRTRSNMQINVALGAGTKQEQIGELGQILAQQKEAFQLQGFKDGRFVTGKQINYTLSRIIDLQGFKSSTAFFNQVEDEEEQKPEQEPPNPEIMKIQMEAQNNQEKNELSKMKILLDAENTRNKDDADRQVDIFQIVEELRLKALELDKEEDFKTGVAIAKIQLEREIAEVNAAKAGASLSSDLDKISTSLGSGVNIGGDIAG